MKKILVSMFIIAGLGAAQSPSITPTFDMINYNSTALQRSWLTQFSPALPPQIQIFIVSWPTDHYKITLTYKDNYGNVVTSETYCKYQGYFQFQSICVVLVDAVELLKGRVEAFPLSQAVSEHQ